MLKTKLLPKIVIKKKQKPFARLKHLKRGFFFLFDPARDTYHDEDLFCWFFFFSSTNRFLGINGAVVIEN